MEAVSPFYQREGPVAETVVWWSVSDGGLPSWWVREPEFLHIENIQPWKALMDTLCFWGLSQKYLVFLRQAGTTGRSCLQISLGILTRVGLRPVKRSRRTDRVELPVLEECISRELNWSAEDPHLATTTAAALTFWALRQTTDPVD